MLKTWIPGTTDFRDQGLDPTDWVNDNVEISNDGKLGKCLYFNGSNARLSSNTYSLSEKWSWSVWIKDDPDVTGWRIVFILNSNGSDADTQTALWVKADETRLEVCNDAKWVSTVKYIPGQWNHIAQTYDGTTTNVYLNGSRISGFTSPDHLVRTNMTIGGRSTNVDGGHVSANNYYKGYLNDFRIWDNEVLSPLEVKRLSQGLVLHYPLNNNGFGNENILTNSTGYNGTTDWSGLTTVDNENGSPYLIVKRIDTTSTGRTFCSHSAITSLISSWNAGDSFTISGYYRVPSNEAYEVGANLFIHWTYTTTSGSSYSDTGFTTPLTVERDEWIRFENTYTVPASYENGTVNFIFAFAKGLSTVHWKNVKLEKGDKATPWCPNSSDELATTMGLDDNIEYDCSGFGNNGTKIGDLTYSSDTPRYTGSTYFEDYTRYIVCPMGDWIPDAITMSCWIKSTTRSARGGYHNPLNMHSTNYEISIYGSSGQARLGLVVGGTRYVSNVGPDLLDGKWHMLAITYNGSKICRYVDGELVHSEDRTGALTVVGTLGVGTLAGNTTYGNTQLYESDVRIYSTALSAEDILSLYNLGGSLDSNGIFHTYEYVEV